MNLYVMLKERAAEGRPVKAALIGAVKFRTMRLAQARLAPGLPLLGVADLAVACATERG